jgi:hypothetical protein
MVALRQRAASSRSIPRPQTCPAHRLTSTTLEPLDAHTHTHTHSLPLSLSPSLPLWGPLSSLSRLSLCQVHHHPLLCQGQAVSQKVFRFIHACRFSPPRLLLCRRYCLSWQLLNDAIYQVGDCIMSIDGHTVYGAPPEEISKRIKVCYLAGFKV